MFVKNLTTKPHNNDLGVDCSSKSFHALIIIVIRELVDGSDDLLRQTLEAVAERMRNVYFL